MDYFYQFLLGEKKKISKYDYKGKVQKMSKSKRKKEKKVNPYIKKNKKTKINEESMVSQLNLYMWILIMTDKKNWYFMT